jgi:hypothetical protein
LSGKNFESPPSQVEVSEDTASAVREAKVAVYNNLSACLMLQEKPKYERVLENLKVSVAR